MFLFDLFENEDDLYNTSRYTEKEDNSALAVNANRKRKTKLTLAHIHRLRLMNDIRAREQEEKIVKVQSQYQTGGDSGGDMGGLGGM